MTRKKKQPGRCRFCRCTDSRACPGGCSWVEADLCSTCGLLRDHIGEYVLAAASVSQAALLRMYREALKEQGF